LKEATSGRQKDIFKLSLDEVIPELMSQIQLVKRSAGMGEDSIGRLNLIQLVVIRGQYAMDNFMDADRSLTEEHLDLVCGVYSEQYNRYGGAQYLSGVREHGGRAQSHSCNLLYCRSMSQMASCENELADEKVIKEPIASAVFVLPGGFRRALMASQCVRRPT
jgi:hypothetical protein